MRCGATGSSTWGGRGIRAIRYLHVRKCISRTFCGSTSRSFHHRIEMKALLTRVKVLRTNGLPVATTAETPYFASRSALVQAQKYCSAPSMNTSLCLLYLRQWRSLTLVLPYIAQRVKSGRTKRAERTFCLRLPAWRHQPCLLSLFVRTRLFFPKIILTPPKTQNRTWRKAGASCSVLPESSASYSKCAGCTLY